METSSNLASVRPQSEAAGQRSVEYAVQCSTRSSLMAPLHHYRGVIRRIGKMCGGSVEQVWGRVGAGGSGDLLVGVGWWVDGVGGGRMAECSEGSGVGVLWVRVGATMMEKATRGTLPSPLCFALRPGGDACRGGGCHRLLPATHLVHEPRPRDAHAHFLSLCFLPA